MSRYADKSLQCRDCGREFVFSAGEQEFYATRGYSEPTRCPDCRAARKASREAGGGAYRGSGQGGGVRSGAAGFDRGATNAGTRQMFKVVCADCGRETEVPFEPRNGRPVYCRDCFGKRQSRR